MGAPLTFDDLPQEAAAPGVPPPAASPNAAQLAFVDQFIRSGRGGYGEAMNAWQAQQGAAATPATGAVFASGAPQAAVPTQAQETYARSAGQPWGATGGGSNPYYDAPGGQAPAGSAHVTPQGYLVDPNGAINFNDLPTDANPYVDSAQSVLTGLERGVGGIVAFPKTMLDLEQKGVAKLAGLGADAFGGNGQATYDRFNQPMQGLDLPSQGQVDGVTQGILGKYHEPQTIYGRFAETAGEFAPAAVLGPEAWWQKGLSAAVPAAISQGATELANDTGNATLAPYARVGGALLGGGLTIGARGLMTAPDRAIGNAAAGLTDAQVAAATALRQRAAAQGIPLSIAEAAEAVAPGATRLPATQRVVEATDAGRPTFAPIMAARPDAIQAAAKPVFDQIAPATAQPSVIGTQAQQIAQSSIDRARQAVNAQAAPMYQNAQRDLIDPSDYAALDADPSYKIALKAVRSNPELGPSVAHLPDNNAAVVNEVVKELDRSSNAARVTEMNPGGNNALAAIRNRARALADRVAGDSSSNYSGARSTVAQGLEQNVTPLQAGPAGAIASTDDVMRQARALYSPRPLEGAPAETSTAIGAMNRAQQLDPGYAPENPLVTALLTRQHLANNFNEATQATARGPNLYGGAQFAAGVAGNPEQGATLLAGVKAAAGDTTAQRLADLLETYKATGARLPVTPTDEATSALVRAGHGFDPMEAATTLGVGKEAFGAAGPLVTMAAKGASAVGSALSNAKARMYADAIAKRLTGPADLTAQTIAAATKAKTEHARLMAQALLDLGLSQAPQ